MASLRVQNVTCEQGMQDVGRMIQDWLIYDIPTNQRGLRTIGQRLTRQETKHHQRRSGRESHADSMGLGQAVR
jgi:hypothetical protein